jgi:SAM-dependent methyltransferase
MARRARFEQRYASGHVPWDDVLPPPEVLDIAAELSPGRALDLGCGFGRAAIHLARAGWQVDAVDYVAAALAEARRRGEAAGVAEQVQFHEGDVTRLGDLGLEGPYDLAIDVGCLHGLDEPALVRMHGELARLLRPGGIFRLFAHLRRGEGDEASADRTQPAVAAEGAGARGRPGKAEGTGTPDGAARPAQPAGPTWLAEADLLRLFAHGFRLERVDYGTTTAGDRGEVPSAWYRFLRSS